MDSAELIDMIAKDASSSEVSDALKDMLYAKSADEVEKITPQIAAGIFGGEPEEGDPLPEVGDGDEPEVNAEVETQDQEPEQEEE
tara:strand:+ start:263 stop:517 length:255 start_codon:yes stop_codon:yes gene_type:complete